MRLRVNVLNKIMEKNVTAKEFELLMYLLRYQDDSGKVVGVYHKMVTDEKEMCGQSFYSALYGLREKGVITYRRVQNDYDIHISGNECVTKGKKGKDVQFLNMDAKFFHQKEFLELTPNAKLIAADLYRQLVASKGGKKWYDRYKFICTYKKKMGLCEKTLQRYLTQLHSLFNFKLNNKVYTISFKDNGIPLEELRQGVSEQTFGEISRRHIAKILLRRSKITYDEKTIADIALIYTQYREKVKDTFKLLWDSILNAIRAVGKKDTIEIPLVHSIFRRLAGLEIDKKTGNDVLPDLFKTVSADNQYVSDEYRILEEYDKIYKVDAFGRKIEWKWKNPVRSWDNFWQRYYSPEEMDSFL